MVDITVTSDGILQGEVRVPGDKSLSHRAVILGSIAQGQTHISGFLEGEDCQATVKAMQSLGVSIENPASETLIIKGVGLHGLQAPTHPIDCQNAGTGMRLLAGLLAPQSFASTLIGDASLSQRPMQRIVAPLKQMGARIEGRLINSEYFAPLEIQPATQPLQALQYSLPVASAQVKSCLLLAGLYAQGTTVLVENVPTRDHTERMLQSFGAKLKTEHHRIVLEPGQALQGQEIIIPGDISSAAFFIAGASFTPGSHIILPQVGVNPRRMGMVHILREMGASIELHNRREIAGEPVADIEVKGKRLKGITVQQEWVASAIDEFPIIFVAAACAQGETLIRGIQELRFKETDRIAVMAKGLKALGIGVALLPDGIMIRGGVIQGGSVDSEGDHRVAMAFAMAALASPAPITISNAQSIATSFPNFIPLANALGLSCDLRQMSF